VDTSSFLAHTPQKKDDRQDHKQDAEGRFFFGQSFRKSSR
jgi:hypothetical protein